MSFEYRDGISISISRFNIQHSLIAIRYSKKLMTAFYLFLIYIIHAFADFVLHIGTS